MVGPAPGRPHAHEDMLALVAGFAARHGRPCRFRDPPAPAVSGWDQLPAAHRLYAPPPAQRSALRGTVGISGARGEEAPGVVVVVGRERVRGPCAAAAAAAPADADGRRRFLDPGLHFRLRAACRYDHWPHGKVSASPFPASAR